MNKIILACSFAILFFGCSENLFELDLSEKEREILNECESNSLKTIEDVETNLIGKWKIISFACYGCQESPYDYKTSLELFQNGSGINCDLNDVCNDITWNLLETQKDSFTLSLIPADVGYRIINIYCERYMIADNVTTTIIYEKE